MSLRRFFMTTVSDAFKNAKSFFFDGINDYLNWNSILNDISTQTTGAVSAWVKIPADEDLQRTYFSISYNGGIFLTELSFIIDFREEAGSFPGNTITLLAIQDHITKWAGGPGADYLNAHIGNWINIIVTHNGTTPELYVNGSLVTLNFDTATDKTLWFKGVLTDATNKSDAASVGILRRNGANITPYKENIDEIAVYSDGLGASDAVDIYNGGSPNDLTKLSSSTKLVSWLRMGDDPLDDATDGTGVIKDQLSLNDAVPTNTAGNNIEFDAP